MTFNIIDRLEIYDKSPLCRHWGGVSSWNNFMQTFETKFPYSCIFFFFRSNNNNTGFRLQDDLLVRTQSER